MEGFVTIMVQQERRDRMEILIGSDQVFTSYGGREWTVVGVLLLHFSAYVSHRHHALVLISFIIIGINFSFILSTTLLLLPVIYIQLIWTLVKERIEFE